MVMGLSSMADLKLQLLKYRCKYTVLCNRREQHYYPTLVIAITIVIAIAMPIAIAFPLPSTKVIRAG